MAYFGPNANILGNIQLAIWQFQLPISNIESYIFNISILMIFDVCSLVLNGTLLWVFCNINVLKILKILQQNYWILFAIAEAYLFMEVKKPKLLVFWIVYALLLFFLAALSGSSNRSRTWSHLRVWLDKWKLQFEIRSNGRNVCSVWISLYWLQNLVLSEDVDSYKLCTIYISSTETSS